MKTIEGYTDDFAYGPAGLIAISEERYSEDDRPAILCYNDDGVPPKVMAVEEKMLKEILANAQDTIPDYTSFDIRAVAHKYGITLNP